MQKEVESSCKENETLMIFKSDLQAIQPQQSSNEYRKTTTLLLLTQVELLLLKYSLTHDRLKQIFEPDSVLVGLSDLVANAKTLDRTIQFRPLSPSALRYFSISLSSPYRT